MVKKDELFVLVLNCNADFFSELPESVLLREHSVVDSVADGKVEVLCSPYLPVLRKEDRKLSWVSGKPVKLFKDRAVFSKVFREELFVSPSFKLVVYLPVGGKDVLPSSFVDKKFSLGLVFATELLLNRLRVSQLQELVLESRDDMLKVTSDEDLSQELRDRVVERLKDDASSLGLLSSRKDGDD